MSALGCRSSASRPLTCCVRNERDSFWKTPAPGYERWPRELYFCNLRPESSRMNGLTVTSPPNLDFLRRRHLLRDMAPTKRTRPLNRSGLALGIGPEISSIAGRLTQSRRRLPPIHSQPLEKRRRTARHSNPRGGEVVQPRDADDRPPGVARRVERWVTIHVSDGQRQLTSTPGSDKGPRS